MVKIKFCGLYRPEDILAANQAGPDYIGFILARKGHRQITHEKAGELKKLLSPSIKAVGVFIDEDPAIIADLVGQKVIDCIQLHGHEGNEYIRRLRSLLKEPVQIIKAFGVKNSSDLQNINQSEADMILLDYPDSGSGKSFDWSILEKINRPFILAGGLNVENIEQALLRKPFMVDISTGIETDRIKDPAKMKQIANRIRRITYD